MIYILGPFYFLPVVIMLARRKLDPGLLLPYTFGTSISLGVLLVVSCYCLDGFELENVLISVMFAQVWSFLLSIAGCITFGVLWMILPSFRFEYHPPQSVKPNDS